MANYFVASGGSNTSPYDTWAKAATSLATALAAATANGDQVIIQYNAVPSGDAELAADTTYTFAGNISFIASTNSGTSTITPTAMGTGNWIGNSTTNRSVTFAGGKRVFFYGITLRTSGSTQDSITLSSAAGTDYLFDTCYLWQGNTSTSASISLANYGGSPDVEGFIELRNCTLRFGATAQGLRLNTHGFIARNCSISSSGSTPSTFLQIYGSGTALFEGCDLSLITGTLMGNNTGGWRSTYFVNCKLGAGVVIQAAQTTYNNRSQAETYVFNCSSGDQHYHMHHYNGLGQTIMDTGIYANDGAQYDGSNRLSWKITTTANTHKQRPYESPWIDRYHAGTSGITPYLEILRDGSSTAFNNDEVWAEFSYQGTSGYPQSVFVNDACALAGSAAAQDNSTKGASDWTGENATAWFGKIDSGASITPAEIGHLRSRVCVGIASATVYVDPQIRGTS